MLSTTAHEHRLIFAIVARCRLNIMTLVSLPRLQALSGICIRADSIENLMEVSFSRCLGHITIWGSSNLSPYNGPLCEKSDVWGLRPGKTQTNRFSNKVLLESQNLDSETRYKILSGVCARYPKSTLVYAYRVMSGQQNKYGITVFLRLQCYLNGSTDVHMTCNDVTRNISTSTAVLGSRSGGAILATILKKIVNMFIY